MKQRARPQRVFSLLVFSLAGLLGACGKDASAPAQAQAQARPVRYLQAGFSALEDATVLPGQIQARHEQQYGFRIGGKIARRRVEVGQVVQPGQVLAVLDSQDVQPQVDAQAAQLVAARSDNALQQSELRRQQGLRAQGFVSAAALERQQAAADAAQARLDAAQAQLAGARNGIDFQTLRADRAGVVMAIDADAGSVVAAGQGVVRVAQPDEKEIAVNVPERDVRALRNAGSLAVRVFAAGGRTYQARLRELAPVADPASRTYAARLSLVDADAAVQLGMSASLQLVRDATQVLVVPNSALYTRDASIQVWLVDPATHTVHTVPVILGSSTRDGVVIASGLRAGDLVVTAGANLLLPGQTVRLLDGQP